MQKKQKQFFAQRRREQRKLKAGTAVLGLVLGMGVTTALVSVVSPFISVRVGSPEYVLLLMVVQIAFVVFYALGYSLGSVRLHATLLSMLSEMDPVEKQVFKGVLEKAIEEELKEGGGNK